MSVAIDLGRCGKKPLDPMTTNVEGGLESVAEISIKPDIPLYLGVLCFPTPTSGSRPVADIQIDEPLNVFGEALLPCSEDPVTGFFRDGCCNTNDQDVGSHTVCIQATEEFLQYSRFAGNDLSTPVPEFGFPGLKPGDRWCLCAPRWLEAYEREMAPKVFLTRTHRRALEVIPLEALRQYAVDLN